MRIMTWQCSPDMIVNGFKKCTTSNTVDETDDSMFRMAVKRMGMLGVSVRKVKGMTLNMETGTLIGKGRYNLTCFMYQVHQITSKIFV
jgi:hypothetical protein